MDTICDCHVHLYDTADARWSNTNPATPNADLAAFRGLQQRIGSGRTVVVQPLLYGDDNRFMLSMLSVLGHDHARGIAIVRAGVTDEELDSLRDGGVVGLRYFVGSAYHQTVTAEDTLAEMRALDGRLHERGMHFQVNTHGSFLRDHAHRFERFTSPLVFDHLGHVIPEGDSFVGLGQLISLAQQVDAWIKVSGLYLDSREGASACDDMAPAVQHLAKSIPDRLLWGTNWPHPTVRGSAPLPDDVRLLERVKEWVLDAAPLQDMLLTNASHLYGFR